MVKWIWKELISGANVLFRKKEAEKPAVETPVSPIKQWENFSYSQLFIIPNMQFSSSSILCNKRKKVWVNPGYCFKIMHYNWKNWALQKISPSVFYEKRVIFVAPPLPFFNLKIRDKQVVFEYPRCTTKLYPPSALLFFFLFLFIILELFSAILGLVRLFDVSFKSKDVCLNFRQETILHPPECVAMNIIFFP